MIAHEMPLNQAGAAFELHASAQGDLWISDYDAGELWRVDPAGVGYMAYPVGGNPSDATPDGSGGVWFVDANSINRLEIATETTETWNVNPSGALYGLALDSQGRLWLADSDPQYPNLYRFNPVSRELCTYPLPDSGQGFYPAVSGDVVWLGDSNNGRVLRLDPAQNKIDWWQLPMYSFPEDIALGEAGAVWFTDSGWGCIGRLVPTAGALTLYTPPVGRQPKMLTFNAGQVWYTEQYQDSVGVLDLAVAAGSTTLADSGSALVDPSPCATLSKPNSGKAIATAGIPAWTPASDPTLVHANGWRIYQLPNQSFPWGIAVTDYGYVVNSGRRILAKLTLTTLSIQAEKTPDVASVPETGGEVSFTFKVTNTSSHNPVTIKALSDSSFGLLAGDADCAVVTTLAVGASCEFSLTRRLEGDSSGPAHANTFTVQAEDPEKILTQASAAAEVAFTDALPAIQVTKAANPTSVLETGENVVFTFSVKNLSTRESLSLSSLSDSAFGSLSGSETCKAGTVLPAGASCQFSITRLVSGSASGPAHQNTFAAVGEDNEQNSTSASASASASVTFLTAQAEKYIYLPLVVR